MVSLSSVELEFREISKGLCEYYWLKRLLTEIGFAFYIAMNICCDNKTVIQISHNPIQHDRTKHIEANRHFIKKNLEEKANKFYLISLEE